MEAPQRRVRKRRRFTAAELEYIAEMNDEVVLFSLGYAIFSRKRRRLAARCFALVALAVATHLHDFCEEIEQSLHIPRPVQARPPISFYRRLLVDSRLSGTDHFFRHLHFPYLAFCGLVNRVSTKIPTSASFSSRDLVALVLYRLANDATLLDCTRVFGSSEQNVDAHFWDTLLCIRRALSSYGPNGELPVVRWPTPAERAEFHSWIPHPGGVLVRHHADDERARLRVAGRSKIVFIIDGTPFAVNRPRQSALRKELFSKYRSTTCWNMNVVCDPRGRIIYVHTPHPGRHHDSRVYRSTPLALDPQLLLSDGECGLADAGYAMGGTPDPRLLVPFKKPPHGGQLSIAKRLYNKILQHSRAVIEHVFGYMAWKWQAVGGKCPLHRIVRGSPVRQRGQLVFNPYEEVFVTCCMLTNLSMEAMGYIRDRSYYDGVKAAFLERAGREIWTGDEAIPPNALDSDPVRAVFH